MSLYSEAIDYALDRLTSFSVVNKDKTIQEKEEAIELMAQSAGLSPQDYEHLLQSMGKRFELYSGFINTGVLVGLFMAQYIEEKEGRV